MMNLDPLGWNLATLFVTTIFAYSLHRFYARKIHFEKIRKYLDLRENDFQKKYEYKIQHLEDASIHFDVDLKKYNQMARIISADLLNTEKKITLFEEIDRRLNERLRDFSQEEERLKTLTVEVQDQLKQIQDRHDEVKRLSKEVVKTGDRLGKIESESAEMEKFLRQSHAAIAKSIEDRMERELSNVQVLAAKQLETVAQREEETLTGITQSLRERAEEFLETEKREAVMFLEEAKKQFDEKTSGLGREAESILVQYETIAKENENLSRAIEKNREEIIRQNAHISDAILENLKEKVDHYHEDFISRVDERFSVAEKSIAEYRQTLAAQVADITHSHEDIKRNLIGEASERIEALNQKSEEMDRRLSEMTTLADHKLKTFQEQGELIRSSLHAAEEDLTTLRSDFNRGAAEKEKSFSRLVDELGVEATRAKMEIDRVIQEKTRELVAVVKDSVEVFDDRLEEKLKEVEKAAHPRFRDLEERLAAELDAFFKEEKHNAELATAEVRDEFRKKTEEIYSEGETVSARLAELEQKSAELEEAVSAANGSIEEKTEHSKALIAEQLVELKQEQESVRAMLNGEAFQRLREMEEKIAGIEGEYHRLNAAVVHAGEVESRLMALEASAGESVAGIHDQIRKLEESSREEWDRQRAAAEALLRDETLGRANLELGKLTGELEKRISAYRQEMDQHAEKLFIRVSDLRERAEKQTEALGMREAAFVQRFERQLVAMEEGKNGVIERFVEETKSRGEGIVSEFEEKLGAEEIGARKMIEKLFKEFAEAREALAEVREEEKAIVADFDKRLKAKEKDILQYFDKCAEEYRQLFQDSAGRTDQKMDRVFHELRDQLVEKLSRMEDEASSRHGSAMATIRALENEAEHLEKTQKEKLDAVLIPQLKQVEKVYAESRDTLAKKGQAWVESLRDERDAWSEQLAAIRQSYEDKVASEEKSLAEHRSDFRGKFQDRIKEEIADFSKDLKSKKEGLDQISKEWKELQNVKREELKRIEDWNRHLSKQEQSVLEMTERFKLRIGGLEKDFVQYKEASKKDLLIVIGRFQEECRNDLRAMQALEVRKTSKEIGGIKALMSKRLARLDEDLAGLLRKKEKAWEQLEERIGDQMAERGREFSAELSRIREEMKRVEADRKQIFVSLEKLPAQYQGEVRKALDRESESVRVELLRIGKDLGIEAERQIAESGRRAASELEKEKLVLRESFARMGQSLGEDRELFQNRLIQYRRELEESMKEMLDESREGAREIENKKALIEAYFRGGEGEGASANGSAPVSLVQWKSELASGFEREWEEFRDSVRREMDQVRTALKSLSVKKDQRYEVFQHELEQSLASYQKKLSQIGHRFDELEGKIEEKNGKQFAEFVARMKESAEKSFEHLSRQRVDVEGLREELSAHMRGLDEENRKALEKGNALLASFRSENEGVRKEFRDSVSSFLEAQKTAFETEARLLHERLAGIGELEEKEKEERLKSLRADVEKRGAELEAVVREQEEALKETGDKLRGIETRFETRLDEVFLEKEKRVEVYMLGQEKKLDEFVEETRERMAKDAEARFASVNEQIQTILGKMDEFMAQTDLFKKVDALQEKLKADTEGYAARIQNLHESLSSLGGIESRMAEFRGIEAEVKKSLGRIQTDKRDVQRIENHLVALVKMAEEVRERTSFVEGRKAELLQLEEVCGRSLREGEKLRQSYDKLLASKDEVDELLSGFHNAVSESTRMRQDHGALEGRIDASARMQDEIQRRLAEIEEKSVLIENQHKKLLEFSAKYEELDIAIRDVEQRQKSLDKVKSELTLQKQEMLGFKKEIDEKIESINQFRREEATSVRALPAPKGKNEKDQLSREEQLQVAMNLKSIGWSHQEIASHLKTSARDIERILGD